MRGLPHFLLVHGHQQLNFAHLAVPHSMHHGRSISYRTPNLLKMLHEVPDETPPIEETDFNAVMQLKDEIEKRLRDGDVE